MERTRREWVPKVVLITGAMPLSIGEEIANIFLRDFTDTKIIVVDKVLNKDLEIRLGERGRFLLYDLNPISRLSTEQGTGVSAKKRSKKKTVSVEPLETALGRAALELDVSCVDLLFNNAGVYDFGPVEKTSLDAIYRVIGVNLLGHIYVLKTVMEFNAQRGVDNRKHLHLCEVGSFQGISCRAGRSIYAPSKAFGLDFCQSLASGDEIRHVVYIAVPPTDTPMLHSNIWATKAGGDIAFWRSLYEKDIDLYKDIFFRCDKNALQKSLDVVKMRLLTVEMLKEALERYEHVRAEYLRPKQGGSTGVATGIEVAETAVERMVDWRPGMLNEHAVVIPEVHFHYDGKRFYDPTLAGNLDSRKDFSYKKMLVDFSI